VVAEERCTLCGRCASACSFNAIAAMKKKLLIFPELCHACGVCTEVCPERAIREEFFPIGTVRLGGTGEAFPEAPFVFGDGTLNVGESQAPAVVRAVKSHGGHRADGGSGPSDGIVLVDASPGTACPVVEAMRDSDVVLLVTEPTPFGLHDLRLAASLSLQMRIPTGVVINRSVERDALIEEYCREVGIPILGRIPFRREYAEAYSEGMLLARQDPALQPLFLEILARTQALAGAAVPPVPPAETWAASSTAHSGLTDGPAAAEVRTERGAPDELGVISGKGGTGKTTVTASLAVLAEEKVLADTDVDAADLHLLLRPLVLQAEPFSGGKLYRIDPERCTSCGLCEEKCHFAAITHEPAEAPAEEGAASSSTSPPLFRIDPVACEGCGLCRIVCPADAVSTGDALNGTTFESSTPYGPMVHARLGIGEENSGKLVSEVRRRAGALADRAGASLILADGPPGVGCPVISSITDLDRVLVVTEPTVSGIHDLERVLDLAAHFGVPADVVINKADLNLRQASRIEAIAEQRGARVVGRIPFDDAVYEALMAGKTVVEFGDGPAAQALRAIASELLRQPRGV
jgi:MinD superfamily P-loop ATPase